MPAPATRARAPPTGATAGEITGMMMVWELLQIHRVLWENKFLIECVHKAAQALQGTEEDGRESGTPGEHDENPPGTAELPAPRCRETLAPCMAGAKDSRSVSVP